MDDRVRKALIAATAIATTAVVAVTIWLTRTIDEGQFDGKAASSGDSDKVGVGKGGYKPKHKWRSVRSRHWQIISTKYERASVTDAREGTRGRCPSGMVEVKGKMMLEPDDNPYAEGRITTMQLRVCTKWIQKDYPERCAVFDRAKWLEKTKDIKRKSMHFCIDRFEYPNIKGQYPVIYISFNEAKQLCDESGKRLCNEDEWTFACEGEEGRPYPYGNGYRRDPKKCITDQKWRPYSETAMIPRDGEAAGNEMDKLWQGKYSGQQKQCRSTFGVYDMTGNIDEWTTSTRKGGLHTILKGGYWGPVRTRCRPSTRSHDQNHTFYQQGFRCCTGIKGKKRRKSGDGKAPASRRALPPQLR